MVHSRSSRYTSVRRSSGHASRRSGRSGPLIAFLLVASFGILFAGCSGPALTDDLEEFTFTAEDVARFREMAREEAEEVPVIPLAGTGVAPSLESATEQAPVLDLSMVQRYQTIRTGPAATAENLYRVTNEFLNVRAEPQVTAEGLARLEKGDTLTVRDFVDAAWAKVELPGGKEGFVAHRYIAKLTSEDRLAEEKKAFDGIYFVNFGFLNVRKDPDAQSEKIGELPGQALVRPLSMDEVWARIPFEGKEGYVAVQYLSPFAPNFLVRQDRFTLPVLHYDVREEGVLDVLIQHIDHLKQGGMTVITLRDFYDLLLLQEERDVRLDPNTVVIALSGVNPQNIKEVSDALRASAVRATLFLQTQHLGLSGISEKTILTLLANGLDLQSGGHAGDDLRSLTNAQVDLELRQSRKLIEQFTKQPVFAIGYTRGGVNDRVTERAAEAGYLLGVSTAPERTFSRAQFLRLPSYLITASTSPEEALKMAKGE